MDNTVYVVLNRNGHYLAPDLTPTPSPRLAHEFTGREAAHAIAALYEGEVVVRYRHDSHLAWEERERVSA